MTIEYWVDPVMGDNVTGDGTQSNPKKSIWAARRSQQASDVDGGMKYRGGIVHLMPGKYERQFIPMPYPKNIHCDPAGNTINDRCMVDPPSTNENYFPADNPLTYDAADDGVILTAFQTDPVPGSHPSTWGNQGGPGISLYNTRNVTVEGHFRMEVWGGLPEPILVSNEHPEQPAEDVFIRQVIIKYIDMNAINKLYDVARVNKKNGRRVWLDDCIIDPDGTLTLDGIEKVLKTGSVSSFAPGLVKTRIA